MSGVFEALVVSGLFLLIAVVAVATVVLARRSRHNSAGYQARASALNDINASDRP